VVVLTAYTDASLVHSAMPAGAAGYVAKETDRDEIIAVLVDSSGRRRASHPWVPILPVRSPMR
jgi:DNA-binding NarL/FixJ family response regulator